MYLTKFILTLFIISLFSCKSTVDNSSIHQNAKGLNDLHLNSNQEKKAYLEQILIDDQAVRDGEKSANLMLTYGKNSPEYIAYVKTQLSQDSINLLKVENYLHQYGYPDTLLGTNATTAPWMVIHHAQSYDARDRNFEYVYEAYLDGFIDDGSISFYLGRMYQIRFGERLSLNSPYTIEEELSTYLEKLDLKQRSKLVEQRKA